MRTGVMGIIPDRLRRQRGSAVIIALAALSLLGTYLAANHVAVRGLRQELKQIEQRQQQRLRTMATPERKVEAGGKAVPGKLSKP